MAKQKVPEKLKAQARKVAAAAAAKIKTKGPAGDTARGKASNKAYRDFFKKQKPPKAPEPTGSSDV